MFQYVRVAAVGLALAASVQSAGSQELGIELQQVATGLTSPVDVTHAGDTSGRLFIVQQAGQIRILQGGSVLPTPFLDIDPIVGSGGNEQGLLGLAFHPEYSTNGFFYVNYTNNSGDTVVARYEVSSTDPNVADPDSAQLVLTFDQPFSNHNGGQVHFGPDGYLHISTGDGGGAGDTEENGQDLETPLGKLLRIDVDGDDFPEDPDRNYAIPPDNPFVGVAGLDEIWAYGLRNPWRFSFDRATGDLWIGDVGQNVWEEIDFQPASSAGGENYGWDVLEGGLQPGAPGPDHPNCFEDVPAGACADLLTGGSTLPVLEYPHSPGNCSVTGGFRYRGEQEGQLRGVYVYADFCSGRIWGTLPRCEQGWESRQLLQAGLGIASFGEDEAGEVFVSNRSSGTLHRIAVAPESGGPVLTPDPGILDFGSTGGTAEVVLQHTGTGADAVVIEGWELSDTASFSVDPSGGANPCGPAPICLPQGASCTITVSFDPQAPGTYDELLTFDANSPQAAVSLIAEVPGEGEPGLSVLVREGDMIPGHGPVAGINDISVNGQGDWLVEVAYTALGGDSRRLILKNGEVLIGAGDPVEPAPSTVSLPAGTSNLFKALNNSGGTAFRLSLDGGPADSGMYHDLAPFVLEDQIATAPQFTPGTPYIGFFRARLDDAGRLLLVSSVDDPAIPSTVDRALVWFEPDGKGGWTEDAVAVEGDVLPGMGAGESVSDFGTDYYEFDIDNARNALYTVAIAGAPTDTNGALYFNETLLVRKGDPSPVPDSTYTDIGTSTRADVNDLGELVFRGNLSGLPSGANIAIVKSTVASPQTQELFRLQGDEAPGTGQTVTGFGTGPSARLNDLGEVVWFAALSGDTGSNQALFADDTLLMRKGVTMVDGAPITTVGGTTATGGITRGFTGSQNGRFVLVRAVLNGADQAAVLIDRGEGGGTPGLEITPASLDFGEVVVGETGGPLSLTLTSTGTADVTVDAVAGPESPFAAAGGTCGPAPFTLAPEASCTLDYSFSPTVAGPAASAVTVSSDAPSSPQTIPLEGVGTGAGQGASPMALVVDPEGGFSDGNGLFEPGELVDVAPAWRNDDVAPQSLTGTASAFTGPPGAAYSLIDAAADYGMVDPGATASCLDLDACYGMGLNDPPRPATHWDATFDEALSDGASGQTWTLHIGDSFTDVQRASLFYSWIETLLHHGVTGGCTATTYCPAAANIRDQMPVFLLKALEGGGYVPPLCVEGEELFTDVPFDSVFCPWIEELAGRGVTAGCGGGDYCPGNPVSRDQMAVFLLKTLLGSGYVPPACTGVFADVPCPSLFADWIEDLVARGITAGCGGGNYCPGTSVSRDQMAVFLSKTFGLSLYGP
ncbi:MAG: PQQ-dependent sugar dehydrogenase [Thermoanaerobaculia bacterium]